MQQFSFFSLQEKLSSEKKARMGDEENVSFFSKEEVVSVADSDPNWLVFFADDCGASCVLCVRACECSCSRTRA